MKRMQRYIVMVLIAGVVASCDTEKYFDGPNSYTDDFENYMNADDLIAGDEAWGYFQLTYDDNYIAVDTTVYRSGGKSVKTWAVAGVDGKASKASINKHKMAFWEGDIVSVSAWYYIEGEDLSDWLFILDLEERASIGAGPGMRLALVDDAILVEHKYLNPNITQAKGEEILFPKNQWVNIRFETLLAQKKEGYVKVWQDDVLIIEQDDWNTLPEDILYFQQGTKGMYTSVEFGNTANSSDFPMTVYVDDVVVEVLND